ncbi:MAG: hypothetical protein EXQ56_07260 [Acidobacteria bacterium]|nr:hypothetical protein [Acidobacteriota bacterium]
MKKSKQLPASLPSNWKEQLKAAGFAVVEVSGATAVSRNGCSATVEVSGQGSESQPRFRVKPGVVIGTPSGEAVAHLLDRGYQKFWKSGECTVPARAVELTALHEFQRDLRAVLGMTTLYNEAIGTVSSSYHYDRVEGREPGKRHESF